MAQRRMIARNIATSKKLSKVSAKAALLYTWMIPFLDDYGCFHAENYMIKRLVVPFRDDFTLKTIDKTLAELHGTGLINLYQIDGYKYLEVQQFDKFQTLKKGRELTSECPPPLHGYSNWKDKGIQTDSKRCPQDEVEVEVEEEYIRENDAPPGNQKEDIPGNPILTTFSRIANRHEVVKNMDFGTPRYLDTMSTFKGWIEQLGWDGFVTLAQEAYDAAGEHDKPKTMFQFEFRMGKLRADQDGRTPIYDTEGEKVVERWTPEEWKKWCKDIVEREGKWCLKKVTS